MKNEFFLTFHHMGLATKTPDLAQEFLSGLGYQFENSIFDPHQQVNLIECRHHEQPDIEIIFPGPDSSRLKDVLSKSPNWIYHICYSSTCRETSLEAMKEKGLVVREIVSPLPAPLFRGRLVSFHYVKGFGLIEIIDEQQNN